jgi:aryl-alcohol dehydrogenase-like predicted oxidoreductase
MHTFPLGSFNVGRVGYGAMQLPGPGVFGPPRDHDEAIAVLRRAIELGINHIDTSQFYGPHVANQLIREALHPYPADLALVSKVGAKRDDTGAWLPAQEPDELRAAIEENLETLGTDRTRVAGVDAQVDRCELVRPQSLEVLLDVGTQIVGLLGGVPIARLVAARPHLAHQSQLGGVGV